MEEGTSIECWRFPVSGHWMKSTINVNVNVCVCVCTLLIEHVMNVLTERPVAMALSNVNGKRKLNEMHLVARSGTTTLTHSY